MKTGTHQLANSDWVVRHSQQPNTAKDVEHAILAVLMDMRTELRYMGDAMTLLSIRLNCSETLAIPRMLRRISANTAKPRKRKRTTT